MSYLRFATKVRPAVNVGACSNPRVSSDIYDPGAEKAISDNGGGPGGNELPGNGLLGGFYGVPDSPGWLFSDLSQAPKVLGWKAHRNQSTGVSGGTVLDTEPHSGTYHGALTTPSSGSSSIQVLSKWMCDGPDGVVLACSGFCRPGDVITFRFWAKRASGSGDPRAQVAGHYYEDDASWWVSSVQADIDAGTDLRVETSGSYQQYEKTFTVRDDLPIEGYVLGWSVLNRSSGFDWDATTGSVFYFDDVEVEVAT